VFIDDDDDDAVLPPVTSYGKKDPMSYQWLHHEDTHHQDAPVTATWTDQQGTGAHACQQRRSQNVPRSIIPDIWKNAKFQESNVCSESNKTKTEKQTFQSEPRQPGETVTVDKLGSPQKGKLTKSEEEEDETNNVEEGVRRMRKKWEYRSRVGIYLGRSPQYGRNVALALDQSIG
jgi:hypothetical protein